MLLARAVRGDTSGSAHGICDVLPVQLTAHDRLLSMRLASRANL